MKVAREHSVIYLCRDLVLQVKKKKTLTIAFLLRSIMWLQLDNAREKLQQVL